jgi:N-acetylated-alpha-linked acidic dipeptidase
MRIRSLLFAAVFGAIVAALLAAVRQSAPGRPLSGFTASGAATQRALEARWMPTVSADRIRDRHRFLADKPHLAGSARDRELAEWTRDRWREAGLEDVQIVEHEVLLPWAEDVSVEMTAPQAWRASMKEDPVPGDDYSAAADVGIPHHAYSASGEAEAEVVYAGSGNPADYDWLAARGIDIRGRIALVRYSVPYSYRGFKALTAQQRGAAGILIYSDPAEDGAMKGKTYPDGPWGNESHIQRGAIVYDFLVPGDPLTPGWPSLPGAPRIEKDRAESLPRIISAPLSARDAGAILESLGGPEAPKEWQGGLQLGSGSSRTLPPADRPSSSVVSGFSRTGVYHVGPGPAKVRMRVRMDDRIRPIWTVTGMIRGSDRPDEVVIAGNHRDAWIYGGVDPSSGSAALMELAETLGALARGGARPRRTILFASWDAEEFTLTSSTEWGEQFAHGLGRNAVAYLNVDSAASGAHFSASAVPALNRLIEEATRAVRDPGQRIPVSAAWRARAAAERGSLPTGAGAALVNNRLGSGSDYTVFLNFLGIPIADFTFDGPYGVYHSVYDNHHWVSRIGDPGFRYHAALVQVWGVLALRLANAGVLPLDYAAYASSIREFVGETDRQWMQVRLKPDTTDEERDDPGRADSGGVRLQPDQSPELAPARAAAERLVDAADRLDRETAAALAAGDQVRLDTISRRLMAAERAFIDPEGIPGRPWYRHQIYAPKYTYGPQVLPGVAAAIESGDRSQVAAQARRLAAALDRAAAALSTNPEPRAH